MSIFLTVICVIIGVAVFFTAYVSIIRFIISYRVNAFTETNGRLPDEDEYAKIMDDVLFGIYSPNIHYDNNDHKIHW